jgi:hypothetical protein
MCLGDGAPKRRRLEGQSHALKFERVSSGFTVMAFFTNSNVEYPGSFTLSCSPERIGA